MPGIVGGKRDYRSRPRGIVVGPGIENTAAEVAQMVVMSSEYVAAVVALPLHLGYHVEKAIVLKELILNVYADALHPFYGLGGDPDDGFVRHTLAIGLVELDG